MNLYTYFLEKKANERIISNQNSEERIIQAEISIYKYKKVEINQFFLSPKKLVEFLNRDRKRMNR
jgi:hypothetical protein